ncbi:T-box transcription factor TBX6-like [Vespula pensylvanica]|nr:T-box transcription factor TBX6-like [Vespula pensylvanica]
MYMKPRILPVPLELQFHAQLHHHHQQHQQMLYRQQQLALRRNISEDVQITNRWYLGGGPPLPGNVKVDLQNRKLWKQFHAETTEMIITKSGRRMFPSVKITVSGLEKRTRYCILLEVVPASDRRQKYVESGGGVDETDTKSGRLSSRGWMSTGFAEPQPEIDRRIYLHPDSPATGDHWMQQLPISFSKLKITNNSVEHQNNIVLTSMHKYQVRIWIIRCDDLTRIKDFHTYPSSAFTFKETEFIAVTAYQNENITKLKIDNNPFAKGFRDSGQSRCKRKFPREENNEQEEVNRLDEEEETASSSESMQQSTTPTTVGTPNENENLDERELSSCEDRSPHSSTKNRRVNEQNNQPKLYRPWTNDSSPRPSSIITLPIAPVIEQPSTITEFPLESYLRFSHRFHSLSYYPQFH